MLITLTLLKSLLIWGNPEKLTPVPEQEEIKT